MKEVTIRKMISYSIKIEELKKIIKVNKNKSKTLQPTFKAFHTSIPHFQPNLYSSVIGHPAHL